MLRHFDTFLRKYILFCDYEILRNKNKPTLKRTELVIHLRAFCWGSIGIVAATIGTVQLPPLLGHTVDVTVPYCRAGLFGSSVNVVCPCKIFPFGGWLMSALSISHWGEGHNFSADFNPNHSHVNTAPKQASLQTTLRPHFHARPKQNYFMENVLISNTNLWN